MARFTQGTSIAGRFEILGDVGEGGMGAVYKARQNSLDRIVALKVLHSTVAFTPKARRRFGREARAIARLNHPHIASVFDFGADESDQTLWLAMEYIDGRGMGFLKREPIELLRLISLADQICSALSAAHARGIIHRDLKPSNILITKNDDGQEVIKLVDFGLAATQDGELSLKGAPGGLDGESEAKGKGIMGTPRYMAPEIFRRIPVDPRVDLYALGIILYEIIAGRPPYPGKDPKAIMRGHLREPIPQLVPRQGVNLPAELERIVYKLLDKDPDERFQDAAEIRDAFMSIIGDYSYVPWAMGPSLGDLTQTGFLGNLSRPGFLSGLGGQTIPPSAMTGNSSQVGTGSAPLVGREKERRTIEQKIAQVTFHGAGGLIFAEGETGIGKTRLVDWIKVRVLESGIMRTISGYFSSQRSGFDGIRMVLDELLGTTDVTYGDVEYAIRSKLKSWDFSFVEIETCVELMSPGGDVSLFEEGGADNDRLSRRERVFALIEQILRKVAGIRPLLLIFEDFHNANETAFSFLEHLAVGLHLSPAPILIFSTIRSEVMDSKPEIAGCLKRLAKFGSEVTRIHLEELSEEESATLVQRLIPVNNALAKRLAIQSGGNAMHLLQIIRYLQQSNKLAYHNGEWELAEGVDLHREVPDQLRDLLSQRLDQVLRMYPDEHALRAIIVRCAILGRQFDYQLIRAFVESCGSLLSDRGSLLSGLDSALEFLVKHSIFREIGHSAEDKLRFHHAIMRDVLLADSAADRRVRELHRRAAELKYAFFGDRASEHALEIASHYRNAKDGQGVYRFTVKAAKIALSSSNLPEAIKLYREAKTIADQDIRVTFENGLAESSVVLQSSEVALEVALLELRLGEYHGARSHFRVLLRDPSKEVSAWARWGLGALALEQGELEEAMGWFEATERDGSILENSGKIVTSSLLGRGRIEFLQGKLGTSCETLKNALDRAQQLHISGLESEILRVLADVSWIMGRDDQSDIYRRRATILAETTNDPEALAFSTFQAALYHRRNGNILRGGELLADAMQLFENLGKRHLLAHCLVEDGRLRLGQGNVKIAASTLREALRLYEGFNDRRGVTSCKAVLAELAFSIGKKREAKRFIDDALEGYLTMGDIRGQAYCKLSMGEIALSIGKPRADVFRKLIARFKQIEDIRGQLCTEAFLIVVLISEGKIAECKRELSALFGKLEDIDIITSTFARALDLISEKLNDIDPNLAFAVDERAELTWNRLGKK